MAAPRSTARPHGTRRRPSVCGAAIGCGVVGGPAEVDATHLRKGVEELQLELASLSVVIFCGHPMRAIQPESRARDTVCAVFSEMGKASGQRVKRSTAVRPY